MRGAWLTILLVGVGCRAVPETTSGSRDRDIVSSEQPLSSTANVAVARSDIVPVAFSTEPKGDVRGDGDAPLKPGGWRPTSQDNAASQGESAVPALPTSLTLEAAIQRALAANPDLLVVRSREPVAHAAYHVAKTYPFNPQFQTQVLPYTRDRNGNDAPVSQQHVIVQTFELAGQRRFRAGAAAADWQRVRGDIRAAEIISVAQTERFFFAALYQRDVRDLAQSLAKLNGDLVGVLERRVKAGQANSTDVALARLQAQSARRRLRLMEANYQTALMNLRNYLDLAEDAAVNLTGGWLDWEWRSVDDVLRGTDYNALDGQTPSFKTDDDDRAFGPSVRRLVAERPDVAAARAAVSMARENLALAEAMRTPNLQIGPMWQRDDAATEFWGIQAQMDIPVVNTGTPLVRQRRAELRQQQITAAQLENRAGLEARAAFQRFERARRLVEQSRGEFARAIPDALKPFEDQFEAGQITLLQVFAAHSALVQSRQSFLDLVNELALAAADVTQTTGLPAQQLILDRPPESNETKSVPLP